MNFKLKLVTTFDDPNEEITHEIISLEKDCNSIEQIGMTLLESKAILKQLQSTLIGQQISQFIKEHQVCTRCNANLSIKSRSNIQLKTLFGNVQLSVPRFYRCGCSSKSKDSFNPLHYLSKDYVLPELYYMEAKWASLMSYGMTANLLQDCLPINEKINAEIVRQHTKKVALRLEKELGEEQHIYALQLPILMDFDAYHNESATVGIDGGYLRSWENKKKNFEAIVGKSIPMGGDNEKVFGFVQGHDKKAKRRLHELLESQGIRYNEGVCFMSDGGETVRELQRHLRPNGKHILEWFHITMRLTVLNQCTKGLIKINKKKGYAIKRALASIKWKLWHGKGQDALEKIADLTWEVSDFEGKYSKYKELQKYLDEFYNYIQNNLSMVIDYGERWRAGKRISTAIIESLVNSLLDKRFSKKQQMQWSKAGAHLLLQIRSKVINHELEEFFRKWYPTFRLTGTIKSCNENHFLKEVA